MRNNDLIATAVCAQYTPEQLHKLATHYYTADEIASAAAKIIVEPGEDGTAPDPVEIAEENLCAALFHTFDGWKRGGLSVKRGEKAAIRCKLWKYKDSPKPEDLPANADPLTRAAAEQGGGDYYMTTAYLFGRWQVEKREPKKPTEKRFKSLDDIRAYNKMLADQRKAAKAAAAEKPAEPTTEPAPEIIPASVADKKPGGWKKCSFYTICTTPQNPTNHAEKRDGYTDGVFNYYALHLGKATIWYAVHPSYGVSIGPGQNSRNAAKTAAFDLLDSVAKMEKAPGDRLKNCAAMVTAAQNA